MACRSRLPWASAVPSMSSPACGGVRRFGCKPRVSNGCTDCSRIRGEWPDATSSETRGSLGSSCEKQQAESCGGARSRWTVGPPNVSRPLPLVVHVVGARPNYMKIAPVWSALERGECVAQRLVHTGQHYDTELSDVFFREL